MSEQDLGAFEMLWDCPSCDTKKLLGKSQRFCPNCGAPQDPKSRYFPSDEDKVAVKDHEFFGADIMCAACGVPNSRKAAHCVGCGAELAGGKDAAMRQEQTREEAALFTAETSKDARREHKDARLQREAAMQGQSAPTPRAQPWYAQKRSFVIATLVFTAIGFLLVLLLWKKEATVTVTGHQWRRTIGVERFGPRHDSEWCDHVPSDAYQISKTREVRSQKKIADGQTCKTVRKDRGDGTFKETEKCETKYREEPVYDSKCHFTVNRWQLDRTLDANGSGVSPEPVWPDTRQLRIGACIGCEREASRHESYTLTMRTSDNKTSECDYDQSTWAGLSDGTARKAKVRMLGGGVDCDSFKMGTAK